jgi:hypothetical protein
MLIRRWIKRLSAALLLILLGALLLHWFLLPPAMERTEIYKGVFMTVESLPQSEHGGGRVMIVEVHWDTPGVRISNRSYDYEVDPDDMDSPHYRLAYADWALMREKASVLINTAIFHPDSLKSFIPGYPVRSNETLVVGGTTSHIHEHSYLMYWDAGGNVHVKQSKPPDEASLAEAVTGIGLQGIPVSGGRAVFHAIGNKEEVFRRTFIGVDPARKILYLMAFDKASARLMLEKAVEVGAVYGGQLDSGTSTNLLIGNSASGVRAHSGIRGPRPLGPYLIISAEPL